MNNRSKRLTFVVIDHFVKNLFLAVLGRGEGGVGT